MGNKQRHILAAALTESADLLLAAANGLMNQVIATATAGLGSELPQLLQRLCLFVCQRSQRFFASGVGRGCGRFLTLQARLLNLQRCGQTVDLRLPQSTLLCFG